MSDTRTPLLSSASGGWYVRAEGLPWTGPFESSGDAFRFALRLGFRRVEVRHGLE